MTINVGQSATQGFASSYHRQELHANGKIYTKVTGITGDQPTESAAVKGTQPQPIDETLGSMDKGEGTITFSDVTEEMRFLTDLGDGYREKKFPILWINKDTKVRIEYSGCRILNDPLDDSEGPEALDGEVTFSFLGYKRNGLSPHKASEGSGTISGGNVGGNFGI